MSIQRGVLNTESLEGQRQPMYFLDKRLFLECNFDPMVESVKVKKFLSCLDFTRTQRKLFWQPLI